MRTREYIEKGESEGKSLLDAMEQGDTEGMQTFDGVIENYILEGLVTKEMALPYASNANNLLLRINDLDGSAPPPKPEPAKDEGSMLDFDRTMTVGSHRIIEF
jgi:twitching motility protein PilT